MQTNDILILANNNFASTKKAIIQIAKVMTKNRKYLIFAQTLKFNGAQIKLNSNSIILIKKSHISYIFLVTDYNIDFTSLKRIIKKKLLPKKQYLA